jgi:hypothetical protein
MTRLSRLVRHLLIALGILILAVLYWIARYDHTRADPNPLLGPPSATPAEPPLDNSAPNNPGQPGYESPDRWSAAPEEVAQK